MRWFLVRVSTKVLRRTYILELSSLTTFVQAVDDIRRLLRLRDVGTIHTGPWYMRVSCCAFVITLTLILTKKLVDSAFVSAHGFSLQSFRSRR